jgi:mannose-6-phosphate isomerase-like protein (cupin superfamily)
MIKTKHKKYNKKWGYEIWIENNKDYCGKLLHVEIKKQSSVHYHKNKKETFYIINGNLVLEYSELLDIESWNNNKFNKIILSKGDSFTIEPFLAHRFYCTDSYACDFIEFSTYHDNNDSYRIIESK